MEITFIGACREVTGSLHMIATRENRLLLDCGMFQGKRKLSREKNKKFPLDAHSVTNVLLSHAHIDHSGRIPLLTANGFKGRIITTRPTHSACEYMLRDSAHIQESDADYLNYKKARGFLYDQTGSKKKQRRLTRKQIEYVKNLLKKDKWYINKANVAEIIEKHGLEKVTPLYTSKEAEESLEQFEGYPYLERIEVGKDIFCTFYDAGHILGSAIIVIEIKEDNNKYVIAFTGDLGRFDVPILRNPTLHFPPEHRHIDLLILESTYGNRLHDLVSNLKDNLEEVINRTYSRRGSVLIPSFAMERSQALVYMLHELYNEGRLPSIPIYVDSPLAVNLTKVFGEHPECYDYETHKSFLENGENPFSFKQLRYVQSVEESMALNRDQSPHIVISASGMLEAGRVLHHLRYRIHDAKNTILFVGYQAENTLGRRIIEQAKIYKETGGDFPIIKFMNKKYPLKAEVVEVDGFSAHADQSELTKFLTESNLNVKKIALVHGEHDAVEELNKHLSQKGYSNFIPSSGETFTLSS